MEPPAAFAPPAAAETAAAAAPAPTKTERYVAIDMLRGVAMLAMALDHAAYFARTEFVAESFNSIRPTIESWPHMLTGFVTNIASGIFFTLAGTSVAFFEKSRRKQGWSEGRITRFLLTRALILLALDQLINRLVYQMDFAVTVLTAIAFCLAVIAFARRLPLPAIAAAGLGLLLIYPLIVTQFPYDPAQPPPDLIKALFLFGMDAPPFVEFPALGWLGLVLLGYVWGRLLLAGKTAVSPRLLWVALAGFAAFLALRLLGGYGNLLPYQPDWPWFYFFIENKQPPSLTYLLLNLSVAVVILAAIKRVERPLARSAPGWALTVLGQTSLFFFVAHLFLYAFGLAVLIPPTSLPGMGIVRGYLISGLGVLILIPVCAGYRRLRRRYSVLSYL